MISPDIFTYEEKEAIAALGQKVAIEQAIRDVSPDILCGCGNCLSHATNILSEHNIEQAPTQDEARVILNLKQPSASVETLFNYDSNSIPTNMKPTKEQQAAFENWERKQKVTDQVIVQLTPSKVV